MSLEYETQIVSMNGFTNSSTKNNQMVYNLPYPIRLQGFDVALASLYTFYDWFNVNTAYGNTLLQYKWIDGVTYDILMPPGNYSGTDIGNFIQLIMLQNGHVLYDASGSAVYFISLVTNATYYRYTLTVTPVPSTLPAGWTNPNSIVLPVTPTTPQLVVPNSTGIHTISVTIGFAPGNYPPSPLSVEYQSNGTASPEISQVNAVNIQCNLVNSSYFSNNPSLIYTFSPNVSFGNLIQVEPKELLFFKAVEGSFNQITVTLTDQDNEPLIKQDNVLVLNLFLRRRRG